MVAPLIPIAVGALLSFGGFVAGKSAGGGAIEIGSPKKSDQTTITRNITETNIFSPTITRTFDIQTNTAREGSTISTKKEQSVSQTPEVNPEISPLVQAIPQTSQGGGIGGGSSPVQDVTGLLLIAGLVAGGYLILKPSQSKK